MILLGFDINWLYSKTITALVCSNLILKVIAEVYTFDSQLNRDIAIYSPHK